MTDGSQSVGQVIQKQLVWADFSQSQADGQMLLSNSAYDVFVRHSTSDQTKLWTCKHTLLTKYCCCYASIPKFLFYVCKFYCHV